MSDVYVISDLDPSRWVKTLEGSPSEPPRTSLEGKFPTAPFPVLVILCVVLLILDMAAPLFVYAYRRLLADAAELILWGTTLVSGFIGVVTGLAINSYRSRR